MAPVRFVRQRRGGGYRAAIAGALLFLMCLLVISNSGNVHQTAGSVRGRSVGSSGSTAGGGREVEAFEAAEVEVLAGTELGESIDLEAAEAVDPQPEGEDAAGMDTGESDSQAAAQKWAEDTTGFAAAAAAATSAGGEAEEAEEEERPAEDASAAEQDTSSSNGISIGSSSSGTSGGTASAVSSTETSGTAGGSSAISGGSTSSSSSSSGGKVKKVCEDSCPGKAKNGVCNEGRPSINSEQLGPEGTSYFEVHCDLGTDCSDCGPWYHTNTDESDSWRPIADIKAKNFTVFTRRTLTQPPFWMAYTDPAQDIDVSQLMQSVGMLEMGFTWVWHKLLKAGCQRQQQQSGAGGGAGGSAGAGSDGQPALVLDVGANFGYYSLLAASHGCRVIAWEPVPYFAAFFKYGLLRSNLTHNVQIRDAIVSNVSGQELTIEVPQRGIWGTAGINGANIDRAIDNQGEYDKIVRQVERVDEVVQQDVLVMKVDVEGFEPMVLKSARDLLLQHEVSHVFMEYSPGVAERNRDWLWYQSNPEMLLGLLMGGYTLLHMDGKFRDQWPDWKDRLPLPELQQVTQDLLVRDIQDAWRLQDGTLGCHPDTPELEGMQPNMFGCGSLPEGLDPQSFRASFGFNTNLWAFKTKPPYATIGGPATIVPADYDIQHKYFVPGGVIAPGYRLCRDTDAWDQIVHRCPCRNATLCGELQQKVTQAAAEGKLPPFPIQGRTVEPQQLGIETW